jgi:hypothetical protein
VTDLETRLREELSSRAEAAGPWRVGGAALREAARQRRLRRLRLGAASVAVLLGISAAAVLGDSDAARDRRPVGRPTASPTLPEAQPEPSWRRVALTDEMFQRAVAAAGVTTSWRPLVTTRVGPSGRVVVLLASPAAEGEVLSVVTVTFGSTHPGAPVRSGTLGQYASLSSLVAQPARLGDGAVLVVLLPPDVGDTVRVTLSRPGAALRRVNGFVRDRLAVVPLSQAAPADVTRLQVLAAGRTTVDLVPAGSLLGADVPRTLERVVTELGPQPQMVQVRTDGRTACRMTVGGWWDGPPFVPWNPFDAACAAVDGSLHLLLADDRRYSSVAGVAPADARSVRLRWADGAVTEVPTAGGDVNAFLGPLDRRADRLVQAEALDDAGQVLAAATP